MNLFYAEPKEVQDQSVIIKGQEAEHITKVLRYTVGDTVHVTDGRGKCYECHIRDFKKNTVFLNVVHIDEEPLNSPQLTLCMGVIKKRDRLEFAVEKAVELGVSKIVLFKGEHSQKGNIREDRLESIAVSAMKQSLRCYLPDILIEDSLEKAISRHAESSRVFVGDETVDEAESKFLNSDNCFLIVGPEGGFSKSERDYLNSIQPIYYSLGEKRLRTETAAIVMVDRFANQK